MSCIFPLLSALSLRLWGAAMRHYSSILDHVTLLLFTILESLQQLYIYDRDIIIIKL